MNKYEISEIFYSLQGEGYWTGTPAVFIRFSGCNLSCNFCDTDYSVREKLTAKEITERIKKLTGGKSTLIVLTGGEPSLQFDMNLYRALISSGLSYYIQMETNGTNIIKGTVEWLTVSPKGRAKDLKIKFGDELKLVYTGQNLKQFEALSFRYFYLQPESEKNTKEVVTLCLQNPKWRLSLQTQKILQIQ